MLTRRSFIRVTGASTLSLFFTDRLGVTRQLFAQIPATVEAGTIPKFVTPMLIPPVMPRAGTISLKAGKNADYYEISMKQFAQQILPQGLPRTTVWGYGAVASNGERGLLLHNAPSLTIEARWNTPVRVKWINDLKDADGNFLPHLLPVDPTLHWANPAGGVLARDSRPAFLTTPGPYTGPVPIVTHVHGAVGVADDSDGYAEAWYLPAAGNIPAEYAATGTWFEFFAAKAQDSYGVSWQAGDATFEYPNKNRASTLWYHDHTLGMTRLNVYAGPAGFYLVRGGPAGDDAVLDSTTGLAAVLPGPAPRENDKFPSNKTYYEIPIAIQDRSFSADGSLLYPDSRAFFDDVTGPYRPFTDVSPIWNPEFFGDTIMVNGNTWPFQTVEQRRYRFRLLNGCNSRFLILDFNAIAGVDVWQIGNEGGFLAAPVHVTAADNRLLLSPAERADVIVDFTYVPIGNHILSNVGPDEPFGGGVPGIAFDVADASTTGQILQFRVIPAAAADPTTPPQYLVLPPVAPLPQETVIRRLALIEEMSKIFEDTPVEAELGIIEWDADADAGTWNKLEWRLPVTENPATGATELWELYNVTADAHPIHIHEVVFEVVNRQDIMVVEDRKEVRVNPASAPTGPEPSETGLKDTVISYPGQVTRVRAQFNGAGQFVWHCHIVEHEDNEMMRPYRIGPVQPGQPM